MIYYTTSDQEALLDKPYFSALKKKEKEIKQKEKETGQIQKYSAYFWIKKYPRRFLCENGKIYIEINNKYLECTNEPIEGGQIYKVDTDFKKKYEEFIIQYPNYIIEFNPAGRYGGGVYYYPTDSNEMPAKIFDLTNPSNSLELEDDDKYDISCL